MVPCRKTPQLFHPHPSALRPVCTHQLTPSMLSYSATPRRLRRSRRPCNHRHASRRPARATSLVSTPPLPPAYCLADCPPPTSPRSPPSSQAMHQLLLLSQPNVSQAARPMGPIASLIPTTEPVHATGYII